MNIVQTPQLVNYGALHSPAQIGAETGESSRQQQAVPPVEKSPRSEAGADKRDQAKSEVEQQAKRAEAVQTQREQAVVEKLKARDRELRAHEAAHAAVGGQYAGSPTYTYQRGPNGVSYAVGGEVSISTSEIAGDPEATLQKAQQIQRAALAPAEPSAQDRRVAAKASQMAQEARVDIAELMRVEQAETRAEVSGQSEVNEARSEPQGAGDKAAAQFEAISRDSKATTGQILNQIV